jgi:hypothetical protein
VTSRGCGGSLTSAMAASAVADIRGKWPASLSFARRVGGILDEYGDDDLVETSFRYFV